MTSAQSSCGCSSCVSSKSLELSPSETQWQWLKYENSSLCQQLNECLAHCNRLVQHASDLRCDLNNADRYKIGLTENEHTLHVRNRHLEAIKESYAKEKILRLIAEHSQREKESRLERAGALILLHNIMTPERLQDVIGNKSSFYGFLAQRFTIGEEELDNETDLQRLEVILAWSEKMNDEYRVQVRKQSKELERLKVEVAELGGMRSPY